MHEVHAVLLALRKITRMIDLTAIYCAFCKLCTQWWIQDFSNDGGHF